MKTVEKRVSFVRMLKEQASVKHKMTKDSLRDALHRLKKSVLQVYKTTTESNFIHAITKVRPSIAAYAELRADRPINVKSYGYKMIYSPG
jgi:hypothetical protein